MTGKQKNALKDDKLLTKQSQDEATTQSETRSQTNPVGRPTLYKPEFCEKVILYSNQGCSITEMATLLEVCTDTLYEWAKVHKEFSVALTRARDNITTFYERRYKNSDLVKVGDARPQEGLIKFLMIAKCHAYRMIFNPPKDKPEPPVINVTFQAPEPKDK